MAIPPSEEEDDMQLPTIHTNGTNKDSLLESLMNANNALLAAGEALAQTAPNGRDYYPQGPAAFGKADDEHVDRLKRLASIKDEIYSLAMEIADL